MTQRISAEPKRISQLSDDDGSHPLPAPKSARVLTPPFRFALSLTFLGFALEQVLRPVIPLIVMDRAGDVMLVGVIAAIHSLPSVLFRPVIGQLIDSWDHRSLLRIGAAVATVAPVGLLLPGITPLVPVRFLQGTAWATYSVATHTLVAKLAPRSRRGEASGYFMAMPAFATLLAPGVGVTLYLASGEIGPVVVATALGLIALVMSSRLVIDRQAEVPQAPQRMHVSAPRLRNVVEPAALPATLMISMFLAAQTLFLVYPPVYVESIDAPIESLAAYYPTYGLVLLASQLLVGRASDRLGRGVAIRLGCVMAVIGLSLAAMGSALATFFAGATAYAVAVSLVSPTLSALTMDRAPAQRLGSAMATYSIGYQLATGASSLLWGTVIEASGFGLAFGTAIALQLATATASLVYVGRRGGGGGGGGGGSSAARAT